METKSKIYKVAIQQTDTRGQEVRFVRRGKNDELDVRYLPVNSNASRSRLDILINRSGLMDKMPLTTVFDGGLDIVYWRKNSAKIQEAWS